MTPFMRYLKRQSLSHFFVHLAGEDSGEKTPGQQQEEGLKGNHNIYSKTWFFDKLDSLS